MLLIVVVKQVISVDCKKYAIKTHTLSFNMLTNYIAVLHLYQPTRYTTSAYQPKTVTVTYCSVQILEVQK